MRKKEEKFIKSLKNVRDRDPDADLFFKCGPGSASKFNEF